MLFDGPEQPERAPPAAGRAIATADADHPRRRSTADTLGLAIARTEHEVLIDDASVTRPGIAVFVVSAWVRQISWSSAWLERFRYGPAERMRRCATYRRVQPLRRTS